MKNSIPAIPVARPYFGGNELRYVSDAVGSGELSGNFGKYIARFEAEFSSYCGVKHGISTCNGTTALHVAVAALGIGPEDEVIVQTLTNMATAFAVSYTGATPIAADIESDTWNIDPHLLERKITTKTKAIIVVHLFGHPVDMDPVLAVARKHNLYVVEDCAQAHGAVYKGRRVGSFGDIACFSFYANKIITTGEGGMVVTDSDELADKVRSLHSLAYGRGFNKFMHEAVGFNYRMPNIIAALGCAQLENIEDVIEMKRKMASFYTKGLADISALQLPVEKAYAKSVYWMYHIVLRENFLGRRKVVMDALKEYGIETRESFVPCNQQRIFVQAGAVREDECPVANAIGENGFYLPSGPLMQPGEQEHVVKCIRSVLAQYS
jgi:perosamine synthetase